MKIEVQQNFSPAMRALIRGISSEDRRDLSQFMGQAVQALTANHLLQYAVGHPNKLGGKPTGFFRQAAEGVSEESALESTSDAATLTINHPGMARAFRDVTITPTKSKFLTIPVSALAYGRRAGEFGDLFVFRGKNSSGKNAGFLARKDGDKIELLFLLCRSVTQKQDRSILPAQEEWESAALAGASQFFRFKLSQAALN